MQLRCSVIGDWEKSVTAHLYNGEPKGFESVSPSLCSAGSNPQEKREDRKLWESKNNVYKWHTEEGSVGK